MIKYTPKTLKKLEELFEEAGYVVRYERGNFNSGYCVLEHKRVVVINKFYNVQGRIGCLADILQEVEIDTEMMSDESLKLYNQIREQENTLKG